MERLVVVGAGMASGRMLEHLTRDAPGRYDITLFGAEPRGNYNRIMLSPVLAGEKSFPEIVTHDGAWYRDNNVHTRFGETVTAIDRRRKTVISRCGETPYDKLVIATGSAPFILPLPGKDLPGVTAFRDLDDVERMIGVAAQPGARAVVIGGGLLGLEAAAALRVRGMEVVVLHLMGHLMERQLDPASGELLRQEFERRGITVHCGAQTKAILGNGRVEAVALDDGTIYGADLVVMAAGIRPETRIATDAGLHVERGIVVTEQMRTSDPDILAIGECVEYNRVVYGLVAPLYDMAAVASATLCGVSAAFTPKRLATQLKVSGVSVYSAGDFASAGNRQEIVLSDTAAGHHRRLVLEGDRLVGAVLYGDTADGPWFFDLVERQAEIAEHRDLLIFGRAFEGMPQLDHDEGRCSLPG